MSRYRLVLVSFVAAAALFAGAPRAQAQAPAPALAPTPAPALATAPAVAGVPPALTAADLSAFVDGIVPIQLSRADIAGAVVAVVKDGEVLFAKGYGYADVEKRAPVTTQTLFRIGSVSKLFTWTAVMQQVEAGKLDLDTDVNQYIDFKIPEGFGKPITLRNLMTHTPGFEDVVKELFVATPKDVEPLPRYLATHVPARIFPPGEVPAYSNYGTTLAGYIVERAAGMPLERYLHERILDPLGMKSTSFAQPLPGALEAVMSKGYKNGTDPLVPFEVVQAWPAGSVSASAEDMSRFIRAFLGAGRLGDAQILKPETVAAMHTRTFGASPALNGMALGFYEETRNGHRIVGHAGDTQAFHTDLHVVPDLNLGFFVSYNSSGRAQVSGRSELWEAILDRYYPEPLPAASAQTLDAKTLAGNYLISRRADSNFLKALFGISQLTVVPQPDGTLVVDGLNRNDGAPRRWRAEGPTTFRAQDGKDRIAFERDAAGRVTLAVDFPFMVFKRVPWYLDKRFIQGLAGFSIGMLLLTSLGWPLAAMTRKHYGRTLGLEPGERRLRLWSRLVGILWLLLLAGWTVFIVKGLSDIGTLSRRTDWLILTLEALTILLCLLSLVPVLNALRAWQARRWFWTRLHETLVALACLGLAWLAIWGHLAKLTTHY